MSVRKSNSIWVLLIGVLFFSCERDEIPVAPHDPGDVITQRFSMEPDYRYQLFYDLGTNAMVSSNLKVDWDLGFESAPEGFHVILNTAKLMYAAQVVATDWSVIKDTAGLNFRWDMPSGNFDSTAIGDWRTHQDVYVIDRGFDPEGKHQGFKKVLIKDVNETAYEVQVANLDNTNEITYTVPKAFAYNFTFLSLEDGVAEVQPPKTDWDLSFTQYTHVFTDPVSTYLVTGVLANRDGVEIAAVFDKDFGAITIEDIKLYQFSNAIDAIGYDWKWYSFDSGSFLILSEQNYIVKTTEGRYFKLHFIDFYDDEGVKGNPTFELQEL